MCRNSPFVFRQTRPGTPVYTYGSEPVLEGNAATRSPDFYLKSNVYIALIVNNSEAFPTLSVNRYQPNVLPLTALWLNRSNT